MGLLEPGRRPRPADGDDARRGGDGLSGSPAGDAGIRIRRIRPDEADSLRAIRLRAVVDAPYAFSGTLAATGAHPPSVWEERARRGAAGDTEIVVFAERGDRLVGMAGALTPQDEPRIRRVHGVWVDPSVRGAGAGSGLVARIVGWAGDAGATELALWVADGNDPATRLYRAHGFEETGRTRPFPPRPAIVEREWRKTLGDQSSRSRTV